MASSVKLNSKVLGLPFAFNALADPNYRVFNKVFLENAYLINIIPGISRFSKGDEVQALYDELDNQVREEEEDAAGLWKDKSVKYGLNEDYYKAEFLPKKVDLERDMRYYGFKSDLKKYRSVVNVLLNEVAAKMVGKSFMLLGTDISSYIDTFDSGFGGLSFYAENSSSVSESASNDIGDSMFASSVKGISDTMKEAMFLFEDEVNEGTVERDRLSMAQKISDAAASAQSGIAGMADKFGSNVSATIMGQNILYPKLWKDSSFSKSYNLSFKFISPYGDDQSIFEYVYLPFFCLLAFALPRQTGPNSYKSPFLLRIDCPGHFCCDMGMVNDFSFVKGGSENIWAANGLPLCIDVTMSVVDMYPAIAAATNIALLRQNIGLSSFLDNMCGLAIMRANIKAHARGNIASKMHLFTGLKGMTEVSTTKFLNDTIGKIFN
jgi:hypothetical protein